MAIQTPRADAEEEVLLEVTAGQISSIPMSFKQTGGAPLDLTGSTVYLVAKVNLTDADAAAVILAEQSTHENAAEGDTLVDVDLSDVEGAYYETDTRLTASVWLLDSSSRRLPYGNLIIVVKPSAFRWSNP